MSDPRTNTAHKEELESTRSQGKVSSIGLKFRMLLCVLSGDVEEERSQIGAEINPNPQSGDYSTESDTTIVCTVLWKNKKTYHVGQRLCLIGSEGRLLEKLFVTSALPE